MKSFVSLMLFTSAGCFVCRYLLPSGGISKTAERVIALVSLAAVLTPLTEFITRKETLFDLSFDENEVSSDCTALAEKTAEEMIRQAVAGITQVPFGVEVSVHEEESAVFAVDCIALTFAAAPEGKAKIEEAVAGLFGILPEIVTEGTDGEDAENLLVETESG